MASAPIYFGSYSDHPRHFDYKGRCIVKLLIVSLMLLVAGCAGTKAAYQGATTLDDTAYVIAEHYSALVKEAADLKDAGTLTGAALVRVQQIEARATPVVLKLKDVSAAWTASKNATTEAALQKAISDAAVVVSDLINALKGKPTARLETNWTKAYA